MWQAMPLLPVAWGEVFDKLTILQIKEARLTDPAKKENVRKERDLIESVVGNMSQYPAPLEGLVARLYAINAGLWDVEDGKRACEKNQNFGAEFIALARRVYLENDDRAAVKREINILLGSTVVEEKSYGKYTA